MSATKRTLDELNKLGDDIYSRQMQSSLRPEDHGKYVAIDVDSGEFGLDDDDYAATLQKTGSGHLADASGLSSGLSDWSHPIMKGVVNAATKL